MKRFTGVLAGMAIVAMLSGQALAIHQTQPSETRKADSPGMPFQIESAQGSAQSDAVQALINILVRKGLVTTEELQEELQKMKEQR